MASHDNPSANPKLTMSELDDVIRKAITEHQPDLSSKDKLGYSEIPILLRIILEAHPLLPSLGETACEELLESHPDLLSILQKTFRTRSFKDLLNHASIHALMNSTNSKEQGGQLPSSDSNGSLASTFDLINFKGDVAECIIEQSNLYCQASTHEAPKKLYNRSASIIQSSGLGKSRAMEEVGDNVMTIPANLREKLQGDTQAYPPPDDALREYFEDDHQKSDGRLRVDYAALLKGMFERTKEETEVLFEGQSLKGKDRASTWAAHLKKGQTDEKIGDNRKGFYQSAIERAKHYISERSNKSVNPSEFPNEEELNIIFRHLVMSAQEMLKCVAPNHSGETNACYVYFDEAHNLTKHPKVTETRFHSQYHNLGSVLAELSQVPIFFIFLSTNSHLQKLAPVARDFPSYRASGGSFLIPPFTELPLNIFLPDVYKKLEDCGEPRSLTNACTTEVMSGMGRPLWYTQYWRWKSRHEIQKPQRTQADDLITFANQKLTLQGSKDRIPESELASLSIRIGITFDSTTLASREAESRQVESHMRIVHAIPEHREYMRTGHSSEPILAEAAARFLKHTNNSAGVDISGPRILAENIQKGFLAKGERGELCGRLLTTIAHDLAIRECPNTITASPLVNGPQPEFHKPVPVLAFLCALFAKSHHKTILTATPVTRENDGPTLEDAFKEAFVCFSHFALADDSKMLEAECLQTALFRGMALQAKDNQFSIDAVIPIHMGPTTNPITTKAISAINLQFKNRTVSQACSVDRRITVPDLKQPVISIVFEFGEQSPKAPLVKAYHISIPNTRGRLSNPNLGPDDNHYSFIAHGCTPKTYNAIPKDATNNYKIILAADKLKNDFPRAGNKMSLALFRGQKPSFNSVEAMNEWKADDGPGLNPPVNPPGLPRSRKFKQGLSEMAKTNQSPVAGPSKRRKSSQVQTKPGVEEEKPMDGGAGQKGESSQVKQGGIRKSHSSAKPSLPRKKAKH